MGDRTTFLRWGKPIIAGAVAGGLLVGSAIVPGIGSFAPAAYAAQHQLVLQQESIVTAGAKLRTYRWSRMKNNQTVSTDVQVLIADLHNPNVKLDVMTGTDGQFTKKANVLDMARATGAVAGVNGDYFDMQAAEPSTLGPQVAGSSLMATPTVGLEGLYAFGITKQNQPIIETFTSTGTVAAPNGQTYPLAGLNRVVGTLGNAIYMYDAVWGSVTRAKDATPHTEVLVVNGVVQTIVAGGRIPGTVPPNGYILSAGGKGAEFLAANVKVGDALQAKTSLVPVNPNLKYTESDFKMLIGGHTMLLIDGAPAAFTRDVRGISGNGNTARTAVGFSKDGRYVYMVTAEHADDSVGPTLPDFQQLLIDLGLWRAVNLDGGGSTTIVSRPLGEFEARLVNTPKDGSQRRVVNGLGIFSTALPAALKDFIVDGPKTLWKGQSAAYSAKAYDINYNPLDPAKLTVPVQFKARGTNLKVESATGSFTAAAGGTDTVVAYSGTIAEEFTVEIIDRALIQKLEVVPSKAPGAWVPGDAIKLEVKATLTDGRTGTIPAGIVNWQAFGVLGPIQQDVLTFAGFAEGVDEAMLVGRFDGFSTPLGIPVPAEKPLTDFNVVPWSIAAEKYPAQAIASVALSGTAEDKQLQLTYDFTAGDGATDLAAYAAFNGTAGIPLPDAPIGLELNVFGDGQGGWLRAEFTDADGKVQRATIAEKVDWTGWRTVSVDLTKFRAASLKRLYVISKAAIQGELAFDNINLLYPETAGDGTSVALTVGKKDVVVGGMPQQLDVAPLIDRERTFVPVRFVVDALGGHVDWDAAAKKVTIRKGGHFVELWIGQPEMVADGVRTASDVAPMLRGGRTMLPLRFVSEQLGLNVVWDPATRGITIQEK